MSEEHVAQVFGPRWVRDELDHLRRREREAERLIITLRRRLRVCNPDLPDEHDGQAWAFHEARWARWDGLVDEGRDLLGRHR